jgi:methylphosphotriester-DNA--protein-cysteine methyltransferase
MLELQQAGAPAGAVPTSADGLFAAGAASYHRPGCRLVDGREEVTYVTAGEAVSRSLTPCRVCKPEGALAS